jgi:pyridoxal phosphate enzyme (YggS family)
MSETAFRDHLDRVRDVIATRQQARGWGHEVRIVVVTKTHGPAAVRWAAGAGLQDVGENRVQEALTKQEATADVPVEWHLIGGLQRNKARHAAGRFALIHSMDRLDLAEELDRRVTATSPQRVLVQVNCSAEPQKGGVAPNELPRLLDQLRQCIRLEVAGLMTMAAFGVSESDVRASFVQLRHLAEAGRQRGHPLPELSMGMSDDYAVAVEEGATMIRLGTVLFGPRPIA